MTLAAISDIDLHVYIYIIHSSKVIHSTSSKKISRDSTVYSSCCFYFCLATPNGKDFIGTEAYQGYVYTYRPINICMQSGCRSRCMVIL